jgi:hypothetical protein
MRSRLPPPQQSSSGGVAFIPGGGSGSIRIHPGDGLTHQGGIRNNIGSSGSQFSSGGGSTTRKSVTSIAAGGSESLNNNGQSGCIGPRKIWARGSCWLKWSLDHLISSSAEDSASLFHPSEQSFARNYALLWAVLSLSAASIALTLSVCSPVMILSSLSLSLLFLTEV